MTMTEELQKTPKPKPGDNTFRLTMPIEKSYTKEVDGRTVRFIGGIASGTDLDYDGERMAKSAIEAFVKAIDEGYYLPDGKFTMIPLRSGHRKEWDDILGWISKAEIDNNNNLWIEAELADTSKAEDLFKQLTGIQKPGRPVQLGFSVGGTIKKAVRIWDDSAKKSIREIQDVQLREISVVGSPAFPTAYVEALYKSVNWDDVPAPSQEVTQENTMIAPVDKTEVKEQAAEGPLSVEQAVQLNDAEGSKVPAQEEKDLAEQQGTTVETQESSTAQSESADSSAANVGNAQADSNAGNTEEAAKAADPQGSEASKSVYFSEDASTLGELIQKLEAGLAEIRNLMSGDKSKVETTDTTTDVAKAETAKTEDTEKPESDRIVTAVTAALETFKTTVIDPIMADMQTVKSSVEEMGGGAVDKSIAVRTAKEDEQDAVEKFRSKVAGQRNPNVIGEAVRVAYERNR